MERRASGGAATRVRRAWRALHGEQRLAAFAAIGLFASMFLPWYEKSLVPRGTTAFAKDSVSAFGAFSFVEAAVLLVAAGVLGLLFARGERRAFHLPGGDGLVVAAAGAWVALLLVWRMFDKPDVEGAGASVGIQWGVFVALAAAGALTYAGQRVRAAHRPEPPLADGTRIDVGAPPSAPPATTRSRRRKQRPRPEPQEHRLFSPDAPLPAEPKPTVSTERPAHDAPPPETAAATRRRRDLFPEPEAPDDPPAPDFPF